MTTQAIIGLVMIVLGYALKIAAGAGWLPGDAGVAGEITGLGWALVGKELWPGSPQSLAVKARASKVPPAAGASLLVLPLLFGCAGAPNARETLEGAKRAQESMERMCEELERTKPLREGVTDALDQEVSPVPGVPSGPVGERAPESAGEPAQPAVSPAP